MSQPDFILLYVADAAASAAFYSRLLDAQPVEASPTFAMFALGKGMMLGLWGITGVEPATSMRGGGAELAFAVGADAEVDARCAAWRAQGLPILQEPCRMDFGYTCVATDPDGHRLRVLAPAEAPQA